MSLNCAVVVPTRNRKISLMRLLRSLDRQELAPRLILIVDSSDVPLTLEKGIVGVEILVLHSDRKSAAHQRNIGISYLKSHSVKFDFVSFLDDDVDIPPNYLQKSINLLQSDYSSVGCSGLAEVPIAEKRGESFLSDLFLRKSKPGSLSKSLINISPAGLPKLDEVDWLIGCSTWKRIVFDYAQFEDDFAGQSLFEDVIFSYRVSRLGKLLVDPSIKLTHHYLAAERPNLRQHYESWVLNRARMFKYSSNEFSKLSFLSVILATVIKNLPLALLGDKKAKNKISGLILGLYRLEF